MYSFPCVTLLCLPVSTFIQFQLIIMMKKCRLSLKLLLRELISIEQLNKAACLDVTGSFCHNLEFNDVNTLLTTICSEIM